MDKSVDPADDFFRYVNGTWIDNAEIPSDKTRWGSFDELREHTNHDALTILKEAADDRKLDPNSDQGKAASLYRSIMDTIARNREGVAPLKPYLAKINSVKNVKDLEALLIEMEPEGGLGFFGMGVGADEKDSNKNAVYLGVGTLGLPDRDYYVSDDKDSKEKRQKYVEHVARMLQYTGYKPKQAKTAATNVLKFETAMAEPMLTRVERRDSRNTYNPMTIAELQKIAPAINWEKYFSELGVKEVNQIIVGQPKYIKALNKMLERVDVQTWRDYMNWTLINRSTGRLTTAIETANWEFYSKTLRGALQEERRDINALHTVNGTIGEALGKLYVEKNSLLKQKPRQRV